MRPLFRALLLDKTAREIKDAESSSHIYNNEYNSSYRFAARNHEEKVEKDTDTTHGQGAILSIFERWQYERRISPSPLPFPT
jgi:hypothetical protein